VSNWRIACFYNPAAIVVAIKRLLRRLNMSRSTLEQVLELLINEENAKAESLLHDFVVEQARQIHEDSLNESDTVVEEELEEIEESEEIESLNDDIEEDSDEIETEEMFDDEDMSDDDAEEDLEMGDEEPAEEIEDRVEDLESALSDLEAEFEKIMAGEDDAEDEGEEMDMDMDMDLDLDEPEMEESVEEVVETEETDEAIEEASEEEEKLEEYTIPASAKEGDNGEGSSPLATKGGADESNAKPVGQNDGNTSGGSASAEDMKTGNVNTVGNKKAPAPKKA
tara:strand:+ start:870 stop:1715 length:846 start_codon:yes stop_codon:yes gene_type:complete